MKKILITGGNRGIGLGIARACAMNNNEVMIGSREKGKGERAIAELRGHLEVIEIDVDNTGSILTAVQQVKDSHGYLDVLINNAGIICGGSDAIDADVDDVQRIFRTNFFGAWQVVRHFLPLLRKSEDPRIINMSSGMGALKDLVGGYAAYRLSKAALNALTIELANELEGEVTVNAMCPGWVRTDMGGSNAHRSIEEGADTAVWLAMTPNIPSGKFFRDRKVINW